jgi:hypothetical protein
LPAAAVFAVSLATFLLTCARTVTLVDGGELIVACASLGVAHPPGFPFYTMVGYLFSLVPVGSVAFRLAAMSAVFAALTAALVALVVGEAAAWASRDSHPTRGSRILAAIAPIGAGLTFAFSATLWGYATVAEVYSLNLALLTAAVWLLFVWRRTGADGPVPWAVGLLLGLGLGVHHVTVILAGPALLAFMVASAGWRVLTPRRLAPALAAGAVGLLSYLYLPLAAVRRPVLNWGDPSSLERFWWHVSARQYRVNLFEGNLDQVLENTADLVRLAVQELGPVGLLAVAGGLVWLWRRDRATLWLVLLVALLGMAYAVNYEIAEDTEAYFLTTLLAASIAVGGFLAWLVAAGRTRRWLTVVAAVAALGIPAADAARHWRSCDRSQDLVARTFVEDTLGGVAPGGVLLTSEWQLYSPWLYLHHIEDFRPDASVVDVNLCRRSWYVGQYLPAAHPELMAAVRREADAFRVKLESWEHDRPYDPEELTRLFNALLDAMLNAPLPDREAHLTLPMEPGVAEGLALVPHGLTMKIASLPLGAAEPLPSLHLAPFVADPATLTPVARTKVRSYYSLMLANRARFLTMVGDLDGARGSLKLALAVEPDSVTALLTLGELELAAGRVDAARAAFNAVLRRDRANRVAIANLQRIGRVAPP